MKCRIALCCSLAALVEFASAQPVPEGDVERALSHLLASPITAETVFREGDELSFQVRGTGGKHPADIRSAQLQASCTWPTAHVMYVDGAQRRYLGAGGKPEYRAPYVANQWYPVLKQNADFARLCSDHAQPDWRVIKGRGDEQWVLVDRNSLRSEKGETMFWAAYDNRLIGFDVPYQAPFAQKREHYAVNCSQQTFRMLAVYDLDEKNRVTDDSFEAVPKSLPLSMGTPDYILLFQHVCNSPETLAQLPLFKPRAKAPWPESLPKVAAPVAAAINELNLPAATRSLRYLEIVGTATVRGEASASRSESKLFRDDASGQLAIQTVGTGYTSQEVSFRGLFSLAQRSEFGGYKEFSALSSLSFTGDWQNIPVGSELSYTRQGSTTNSAIGEYGKEVVTRACTVKRELPASELNSTLSGVATALSCNRAEGESVDNGTLYYLKDYALFFSTRIDGNAFCSYDRQLHTVK